jgi:hypothetical protein
MILDKNLQVSTDQVVTANARSTDVIDLKQDRDIGIGEPMFCVVNVKAVSGTSPTLQVAIHTDDNSSFSSAATLAQTAAAAPAANSLIVIPLPRANERYLSLYYTVGGTSPSFTLDSYLTATPPPGWQAYPGSIPS